MSSSVISFAVLLLLSFSVYVKGDEAFVKEVCAKSLNPEMCTKCFDSNKESLNDDMLGLTQIILDCAHDASIIARSDAEALVKSVTDSKLKEVLGECSSNWLGQIGDTLVDAHSALSKKDYENAKTSVHAASGGSQNAWKVLYEYAKDDSLQKLHQDLSDLSGYCGVASGLLDNIQH